MARRSSKYGDIIFVTYLSGPEILENWYSDLYTGHVVTAVSKVRSQKSRERSSLLQIMSSIFVFANSSHLIIFMAPRVHFQHTLATTAVWHKPCCNQRDMQNIRVRARLIPCRGAVNDLPFWIVLHFSKPQHSIDSCTGLLKHYFRKFNIHVLWFLRIIGKLSANAHLQDQAWGWKLPDWTVTAVSPL